MAEVDLSLREPKTFRPMTSVPFVVNTGFDKAKGRRAVEMGQADAVAHGVRLLANPDLMARLAADAELNTSDPRTFHGRGPEGYTDYPTPSQQRRS